jgi:hypothetical protein
VAIFFPAVSQKDSSSTFQLLMFVDMTYCLRISISLGFLFSVSKKTATIPTRTPFIP